MPLRRQISACAQAACSTQLPICTISSLSSAGGRNVDGSSSALGACPGAARDASARAPRSRPPGRRRAAGSAGRRAAARWRGSASRRRPSISRCALSSRRRLSSNSSRRRPPRPWPGTSRRRPRAASPRGRCRGRARPTTPTLASIETSARAQRERVLERVEHALGQRQRLAVALDVLGEDHELVAAEARDRVAVAHQLGQPLGDGDQQPVADVVSEVVVDRLELVEVDEQHRHDAVAAVQARERLARAVHQQQAVGQARERIVQRLALEPHAVGDVLGGRVPGVAVAARAPQQPAPGAVAMAVAVGEVLELGRAARRRRASARASARRRRGA